ncbi:MAG: hypothetical protein R3C44_21190 [Chloroflexota bacterium]
MMREHLNMDMRLTIIKTTDPAGNLSFPFTVGAVPDGFIFSWGTQGSGAISSIFRPVLPSIATTTCLW